MLVTRTVSNSAERVFKASRKQCEKQKTNWELALLQSWKINVHLKKERLRGKKERITGTDGK